MLLHHVVVYNPFCVLSCALDSLHIAISIQCGCFLINLSCSVCTMFDIVFNTFNMIYLKTVLMKM